MRNAATFSLLLWLLFQVGNLLAHSPEEGSDGIVHETHGLVLPSIQGGARPWSDKPLLNDDSRFHFAVMTDRTGGHRPGVWMHAVRNLNLLRPEFAISVGDLIEGYTDDENRAEEEWKEFLGFIDELEMRFFFVAGNHDVTNPMLHRLWRQHFGKEWYSFDYKGVHFLCLSSEDPSASLGEEQVAWAMQDLREHADARWTFVFMHKPLWVYAERELAAGNPDGTNWKKIETALGERPHTVFAGHVHHYVQFERNGSEYYQLATTGGGSQLRGEAYGEFDHVVWVTMEEDGPRIANILLDGVLAPNVVTEQSIQRFREFLDQTRLTVAPILIRSGGDLQTAAVEIEVSNGFDDPIQVDAKVLGLPLRGLTITPDQLNIHIAPHQTKRVRCDFRVAQPLNYEQFRHVAVSGTIRTQGEKQLVAELTVPVTIDRRHDCPRRQVAVDGDLGDWKGDEESFPEQPTIFGARQQWQGLGDAGMTFRVGYDPDSILLSGRVTDDKVVTGRDAVYFGIDVRNQEQRLRDSRLGRHAYSIQIRPNLENETASEVVVRPRRGRADSSLRSQFRIRPEVTGYSFEVSIDKSILTAAQGDNWTDFQLNAVLRDVDAPEESDVYLSWRPALDIRNQNTNYAFFFRDDSVTDTNQTQQRSDAAKLIAHRGGVVDETRIENSLPAIQAAIAQGYEMLEVDIRESRDGHLVVHHDANFRRFYGDDRRVADLTWEEIQQLRSEEGNLRPLEFHEFAAACRGKIRLMLDTKGPHRPSFFDEMEDVLRKNGLLENAFVIGTAQSQEHFLGKAKIGVDYERLIREHAAGKKISSRFFLFEHGDISVEAIQFARSHGVTIVPSINIFHYPRAEHMQRAKADIERLPGPRCHLLSDRFGVRKSRSRTTSLIVNFDFA